MRYVLAVAEAGGVRTAAAALFVSPQTLSEHVRRAENDVGGALFHRTTTGMTPTALGEVYISHASQAVAAFDAAERALRAAASGTPAGVRIAWAYGLAGVLRRLLAALVADAPERPVRAVPMDCAGQLSAVARGDIGAGVFHRVPANRPPARVRAFTLEVTEAHVLLPEDHRLAASPVKLTELAGEPLLLPADSGSGCLRGWELAAFASHGLTPKVRGEVHGIDVAAARVAAGDGYAMCVPPGHPVPAGVRFVPIADALPPQRVGFAFGEATPPQVVAAARGLARRRAVRPAPPGGGTH
ncbi:DNA-binding transcriptional LysR family regulator [Stackebrandtia albiflava]|uniref:DNA-binding transcriptional LysR family regulator n=2 Tax=Stackebrandtia albiflava TaxID=406432 RepID=A0A562URP6_9ACTN|nr:DNA-binding transcriptional LysR family regulator [Stackebrandtia albiflava]